MTAAVIEVEAKEALAVKLVEFLETGQAPDGLFAPDVFCDLTLPTWRVQSDTRDGVVALRREGHPGRSTVLRSRFDPTPTGFVFEMDERWVDATDEWYARELFRADVGADGITFLTVYCTGDWDTARRAEHAAAVTLLRP